MNKSFIFFFLLFCSVTSFSQTLFYKSNGNILNAANEKISPDQIRDLLKDNQNLLTDYSAARTKKKIGNILFNGGLGVYVTVTTVLALDFADEINLNDSAIIGIKALYFVGLASIIVSIPIKIEANKKIKKLVNQYNYQSSLGYNTLNAPKLDLITNSNGIGLRFTLN